MKRTILLCILLLAALLAACGKAESQSPSETPDTETEEPIMETNRPETAKTARLLYCGHASLRIVTPEDKVMTEVMQTYCAAR